VKRGQLGHKEKKMNSTQKEYILGRFPTTAPPCTKDFRVDAGAQAAGTATTETFPKGSLIYGFRVVVTEAPTSGGSATFQFGFTGQRMISEATIAIATLVAGYVVGADVANGAESTPYVLNTSDTFDIIVGTATCTAGKFDITVFYHPPNYSAFDSSYKEWVTA